MKTDRQVAVMVKAATPPANYPEAEVAAEYLAWFADRARRHAAWANKMAFAVVERAKS